MYASVLIAVLSEGEKVNFIKRHKILSAVVALILVFSLLVSGTVFYFLNKINITDRNTPPSAAATSTGSESSVYPKDLSAEDKKELEKADSGILDNLDDRKTWFSDEVTNIALLGIDYGDEEYPCGRSDAMIVLSINKAVKKIKVISLSRTVYSAIPGHKNARMNHAHGYGGAPLTLETIELNYKIAIDNYVSCGFDSFQKIIDILGGVDATLTDAEAEAISRNNTRTFEKGGKYTLDGKSALKYARLRSIDSDQNRTGRQRKILLSLFNKLKKITVPQAVEIAEKVLPLINTDLKKSEIMYQLVSAIKYFKWDISQYFMPSKVYKLVMRDWFEVTLIDWPYEVNYIHKLIFEGVTPKYKEQNQ